MTRSSFSISRHAAGLAAAVCAASFLGAVGAAAQPAATSEASASTQVGAGELLTIERVLPEQVFADSENRFVLRASNNSDKVLHNVVLHHAMVGQFEVVQTNTPSEVRVPQGVQNTEQGGTPMAQQAFNLGVLMPGQSREVTIAGRPGGEGRLHSCVWADYSAADCALIDVVNPELVMEHLFVDADGNPVSQAYLCDDVYVMYRLRNVGSGEAPAVTIQEQLPEGLVAADGGSSISLEAGSLAAGDTFESEPVLLDLERASMSGSMKEVYGRAIGTGRGTGELSGSSVLRLMKPEIQLEVRSPGEQYFGRDVTLEAVVTNVSDVPARDVVVVLPLPENARRVSLNDASLTVAEGGILFEELAPGQSRTVGVTFAPGEPGDYSGQASANAYCAARVQRPVQLSVVGIPALQVEAIDTTDPVEVGGETTYRVRIVNEGNAADTNVTVTGSLPEGFTFVSATEGVTNDGQELSFPIKESLAPGEELYFEVVARAEEPGRVSFQLDVRSDNLANGSETEPTTAF